MAERTSAGLLMYRRRGAGLAGLEVLLVHPGGPFWARKDLGAWSIPKGECNPGERPIDAAAREFREETSFEPGAPLLELGAFKQPGGKRVIAWAFEGDCDPVRLRSNTFEMEWPPRSGRTAHFPEVDRGAWFTLDEARRRIFKGQAPFLDQLAARVSA
jgi:predicted NUDIX family NTP pyrophosphohydrolase